MRELESKDFNPQAPRVYSAAFFLAKLTFPSSSRLSLAPLSARSLNRRNPEPMRSDKQQLVCRPNLLQTVNRRSLDGAAAAEKESRSLDCALTKR